MIAMKFWCIFILAFAAAYSGMANYLTNGDSISLKEMIRKSDLIVVVSKLNPFTTVKKKRTSFLPWKPPFEILFDHYKIEYVVYQSGRGISISEGDDLKVRMADYHGKLTVHKLYYNKGIGKIPVYQWYASDVNLKETDRFIIFCQHDGEDKTFQYVARDSFASEKKLNEVASYIE